MGGISGIVCLGDANDDESYLDDVLICFISK